MPSAATRRDSEELIVADNRSAFLRSDLAECLYRAEGFINRRILKHKVQVVRRVILNGHGVRHCRLSASGGRRYKISSNFATGVSGVLELRQIP